MQEAPKGQGERTDKQKPCNCDDDVTSVIDNDVGVDDEAVSIAIVGGGPHALSALAALHEGSLAFQQFGDDSMFQSRVGFESLQKVGTVCVIDPGARFNESWNARFDSLEIQHLRSPAFAHPMAFESTALLNYAIRENRTAELIDAPFANGKWLATTDLREGQGSWLKALPSSALFRDFCEWMEGRLPHTWLSGKATSVCKDEATGKYRVHYTQTAGGRERKVVARAVILATGPVGKWNVPAPFGPHIASPLVIHTEELLVEGQGTLREAITRRCQATSGRVLVIGGGISAAQAALAAYHAGHEVVLRSRRPLRTRAFDITSEWLDARHADRLRFEFLSLPVEKRRDAIREAQSGGSVPARYMEELRKLSQASSAMTLEVDEEIDCSKVSVGNGLVTVNGEDFNSVVLATGVVTAPSCSPLYRSVEDLFDAPTVDGLPNVDTDLRWAPEEDVFVLGANAGLQLGPGGGNLMGAMRGAKLISNELHSLMWKEAEDDKSKSKKVGSARHSIFANQYAMLEIGDGDEEESDGESSEEEEPATTVAPQATPPPKAPTKKLTKAEIALRKARKHRKATKPRRGSMH